MSSKMNYEVLSYLIEMTEKGERYLPQGSKKLLYESYVLSKDCSSQEDIGFLISLKDFGASIVAETKVGKIGIQFIESFFGGQGISWDQILKQFEAIVRAENLVQTLYEQNGRISGILKQFSVDYMNQLPATPANREELTNTLKSYIQELDETLGIFREESMARISLPSYVTAVNLQITIYQEAARINTISLESQFIKDLVGSLRDYHIDHIESTYSKILSEFENTKFSFTGTVGGLFPSGLSWVDRYTGREYSTRNVFPQIQAITEAEKFEENFKWFRSEAFKDSMSWIDDTSSNWKALVNNPIPPI